MMKALKIALGVVLLAVAVVFALALAKPSTFRVERSATIKAPPEKVFAQLNDFQAWRVWSPWEKKDPAMKRTFSGPQSGKGAIYAWDGNDEVGAGSMEIIESTPPSHLAIKLEFLKPMQGSNVADFALAPEGEGTRVTWSMTGPSPFVFKVMQVFIDCDKMIGKDFEIGLQNLKQVAER